MNVANLDENVVETEEKKKPGRPPKVKEETKEEPKATETPTKTKMLVLVRHTPFPIKKIVVEAESKEDAFKQFCDQNMTKAEDLYRKAIRQRNDGYVPPIKGIVEELIAQKHEYQVSIEPYVEQKRQPVKT